ncbi:metal-sensing transcriptional repressor [Candidatus Daviesbacteria bacterium]|nr:metal-sensing transcriptional repressor [Candidatus Daviesbacteria bacterium]
MKKDKNVNTSISLSIDGERSRTIKSEARKRINIVKGQLDGLLKMIEEDEYCIDLLNQSLAIQNSIKSLDAILLEKHLRTHVANQFQNEQDKAVEELLRLFKRVHQ